MRHIDEIIIHCTATRPDWWKSKSAAQKVREVRRWHVDVNGWSDLGYHILIDRSGAVIAGRPMERAGAHTKGHNKHSIGISLFGGHGSSAGDNFSDHFTKEQEDALRRVLADLQGRFPIKKISGHNQYSTKACPGFSVPSWLHDKTVPPMRPPVSDDVRTSRRQSSTMKATAVTSIAGAGGVITALSSLDPTSQYIVLGFSALAMVGLGWIARERLRKWAAGDR
jgi:N-acetylmuramoyl-L-alanine amidase